MAVINGHELVTPYERSGLGLEQCPRCGALEDLPCYSPSGAPAPPHTKRLSKYSSVHTDKTTPPPNSPMVLDQILTAGAFRIGSGVVSHEPKHFTGWSVIAWCGANGNAKTDKGKRAAHPSMGVVSCKACLTV